MILVPLLACAATRVYFLYAYLGRDETQVS